jgi:hypothetical protein
MNLHDIRTLISGIENVIGLAFAVFGAYYGSYFAHILGIGAWELELLFAVLFYFAAIETVFLFKLYFEVPSEQAAAIKAIQDINSAQTAAISAIQDNQKRQAMEIEVSLARIQERVDPFASIPFLIGHVSVYNLLLKYSKKYSREIFGEEKPLKVEDYLSLLEMSLEEADLKILSTSLVLPHTWMSNPDYKGYLEKQGKKISDTPGIEITRIFICNTANFNKDTHKKELIDLHKRLNIKIGLRDYDALWSRQSTACIDLVLFESKSANWCVNAGKDVSTSASAKDIVQVQLHVGRKLEELTVVCQSVNRIQENVQWL